MMDRAPQSPVHPISIFAYLQECHDGNLDIINCTKATLIQLSHAVENLVLREQLPAIVLSGFQESRYWQMEAERYSLLAATVRQVCVFAGGLIEPESDSREVRVALSSDDPLRDEWFVCVVSPRFSIVLCARDSHTPAVTEATRCFETFWTFDLDQIAGVFDQLMAVVAHYRPERVDDLYHTYRSLPTIGGDLPLMSSLTREVVRYQEHLQSIVREQEIRYRVVSELTTDYVYSLRVDAERQISAMWTTDAFARITGYTSAELEALGGWPLLIYPEDWTIVTERVMTLFSGQEDVREFRIVTRGGDVRWVRDYARPLWDKVSGRVVSIVGAVQDITQHKQVQGQLQRQALYDTLTGLPNRVLLLDRIAQALALAARDSSYIFAILFLDLDRFKTVNDSLGHLAGDQLLVHAATRLVSSIRPRDTAARLGGDEFVVLLDSINDAAEALQVADRIQHALMISAPLHGHEVEVTTSIGIVLSGMGYTDPTELLRDADIALYRAKTLGRARAEVFDIAMHEQAMRLLRLEADLRRAVEREELVLHYQPVVDLRTGEVIAVEALVRWQHSRNGLVPPDEFIPLAEETGIIISLGQWVIHAACKQLAAWQAAGLPALSMAINVSARQVRNGQLRNVLMTTLRETGVHAHRLIIELTESHLMEHAEMSMELLHDLRALGVRIAIDDFGTGYSSLSYLKRLPIDSLKIDRSFVQDCTTNQQDATIISAVIAMAQALRLTVVAEGVETADQLALMREQGCDAIQGYLVSRPLPADRVVDVLRAGHVLSAVR